MARAGNAVIGALKIVLGADTAAFETGLKQAQSALGKFGKSINKPMAVFSAAIAGAAGTLATGIQLAVNRADEMNQAAQKFGVPIEQLSALAHAADLADVSFEALGTGLKKFSQAISSNAPEFAALGIDLKDGLEGTDERLLQVADAFAAMQDGANKTALAMKLFGKTGIDMIPLLNEGAAGIRRVMEEAKQLGLVITAETGEAADRFNDNISKLGDVTAGVFLQLAAEVAGPMADFTDQLIVVSKEGNLASGAVGLFRSALGFLPNVLIFVNEELTRFTRVLQFYSQVATIISGDDISDDFELIGEASKRLAADLTALTDDTNKAYAALKKVQDFKVPAGAARAEGLGRTAPPPPKPEGKSAEEIKADEDAKKAADQQAEAVKDLVANLKAEAAALGLAASEAAILNNLHQAGAAATDAQKQAVIEATEALTAQQEIQDRHAAFLDKQEDDLGKIRDVYQSILKPAEQYAQELAELNRLFATGEMPIEAYNRALKDLKGRLEPATVEIKAMLEDIADALQNTLTNVFDDLIDKTFTWKDALADALRLAASIISNIGTRGIEAQGGWSEILGFAQGGSFQVGGAGGTDSQLVTFRASPNETVTVTTPTQQRELEDNLAEQAGERAKQAERPGKQAERQAKPAQPDEQQLDPLTLQIDAIVELGQAMKTPIASALETVVDQSFSWKDAIEKAVPSGGSKNWGGILGFAQGGTFAVGGSGGTDSQPVTFRASPNETVTVTTPTQKTPIAAAMNSVAHESFTWKDSLAKELPGGGAKPIVDTAAVEKAFPNDGAKLVAEKPPTWKDALEKVLPSGGRKPIASAIDTSFTWKDAIAKALPSESKGWSKILGFAQGGSFTVGGSGGIDSQLVQFMATPGEVVNVSHGDETTGGFAFAPVTQIDARGSTLSEAKLKAILDQRDQQWRSALPGAFKQARIQGKV